MIMMVIIMIKMKCWVRNFGNFKNYQNFENFNNFLNNFGDFIMFMMYNCMIEMAFVMISLILM